MKLHSSMMVTKTETAENLLLQLSNGLKYFDKYYCRLSRTYHCIEYGRFESLKDFCFTQYWKMKDETESVDMMVFFVILKDIRLLRMDYKKALDLEPTLYSEFLKLHDQKVYNYIYNTFNELLSESV